ncbi:MAG TPA: NAD(P)-dependent oxidoreductase [Paenirhodobacter sp.]
MANIVLIGASGNGGSRILAELSARGHTVTAIARNPDKIAALPGVTALKGDVFDQAGLTALLKGHDVVISAVHFTASDPQTLLGAVRASGVPRYVVMGGAGSLLVDGKPIVEGADFPAAYKEEAQKGAAYLALLKTVTDLDWTFLSPSAVIFPGERTGIFRLGKDDLLIGADGSKISFEDFAVALVDEIETPAHIRQRFTVGY